ncbi:MAG: replicative DNA helicase [Phycisphaeraceae bacterium]|nr:replicative DNA helicase [Phycisphaerae bacterium]MBX3391443.1 replicative DNA helicase [Phycisphaeraceae bacterium]
MSSLPFSSSSPDGDRPRGPRGGRPRPEPLGKLFDRLPPHSIEAEMSLLGSMILDPQVIADVLPLVNKSEDFYNEAHGAIFRAVVEVYDKFHSGDLVQIAERLKDTGTLDAVGGPDYLVKLAESVPSSVNAPHYARIVGEKAKIRRLIDAAGQILHEAYHTGELGPDGAREVLDRAEATIFEIAQERTAAEPEKLSDLLQIEIDRIESSEGKGLSGLPTGYHDLDALLHGLQAGELIIVAARPSMGKTALALNLGEQVAMGASSPGMPASGPRPGVAIFSLEMSRGAVTQRLLSARSGIGGEKFRGGHQISAADWQSLLAACDSLREAPIFIDDTPGLTVLSLRARARRLVAQHQVRCIIVDYLQLLTAPGSARESRQVEVSAISRGVKALARELRIPVICLSQLNRATEQREGNRPRMSDLRESGSIEQDADVVILLHREDYYHRGDPAWDPNSHDFDHENHDKIGTAELIIAKQRNGPTGTVRLTWDAHVTRFRNHSDANPPGGYGDGPPPPRPRAGGPAGPGAAAGPYGGQRPGGSNSPSGLAPPDAWPPRPGSSFPGGPRTGPVDGHRDGGGPDRDRPFQDENEEPPF